ncbi:PHP family phosphohydrolase, histidinol phosphatase [Sanguibacter keddieii DSM 10542]|uniref:PHP family phosphohydrolase, histidinol phosphatase n=1 Tax=Sanguibacter keddieii (strain ATCC 51767 / DSM 10542 / NCFB 3025 / ST-74) TaxID=446469 RepID=D1BIK0_SANKS|nr:PHP family phosphohydrolase, histidinol phosphatase [Sanguibacter keddieii DSM 10542]
MTAERSEQPVPPVTPLLLPSTTVDGHVHSTFSDDAVSSVDENLAAAVATGLTSVTFVDHVRSTTAWVPEMVATVRALSVSEGLEVRCGVETKLLDVHGRLDLPRDAVVGTGGLDVVLVGDHQFPGTDGPWSPSQTRARLADGLSAADAVDQLVAASVAAMVAQPGIQLAHWFSILPKVGLSEADLTDEHLHAWASAARETGSTLEVNEKWACPGPRAVRAALLAGASLVVATDSHDARDVGRYVRVPSILAAASVPGAPAALEGAGDRA